MHAHATASVLRVIDGARAPADASWWGEVLAGAVRPEFSVEVFVPEPGELILFGHVCAVDGCPRRGNSRPDRADDRWLCVTHGDRWAVDGRPGLDEWLAGGVWLLTAWKRRLQPCAAAGCERSRCSAWWCFFHRKRWIDAGRPEQGSFARGAARSPIGEARCEVPGCSFPAMPRTARLCDAHKRTFDWARGKGMAHNVDEFLVLSAETERRLVPHYDFGCLDEPLRSELRYVGYSQDKAEKSISRLEWFAANCGMGRYRPSGGEDSLGYVNGRGEPNWQPISMLATIASLIDGGLADAREHYAMLLRARPKPFVLDDATIAETKRVNGEGLEWCDVYDRQLERWRSERLTGAQQGEVARLQGVAEDLRVELARILELADELGRGTIERQLAKSDLELGLERLSTSDPKI